MAFKIKTFLFKMKQHSHHFETQISCNTVHVTLKELKYSHMKHENFIQKFKKTIY